MKASSPADWDRRLSKACGGSALAQPVARAIGEALIALHRLRGDGWAVTLTPAGLSIVVGTKPVLEALGSQVRFFAPAGSASQFKPMRVAFKTTRLSGSGLFGIEIISLAPADFPRVFTHVSAGLLAAAAKALQSGRVDPGVHQLEAVSAMRRLTKMDLPDPSDPAPPSRKPRSASRAKPAPMGIAEDGSPALALSIRQPYADQIMLGLKVVEYRSRPTNVRGRVHIYASLAKPRPGEPDDDLPRGVLVGTVEIVDCSENATGFGWHLAKPRRASKLVRPAKHPQPVFFRPF